MKVLQFYTSTGMRDAERVDSQDALLCPVHKFLPFQIQRDHVATTYIDSVMMTDCDDNDTDVSGYFHNSADVLTLPDTWISNGYNTFIQVSGTGTILTAIESDSANAWCYSTEFALATGDSIVVDYNLTLNSGTRPDLKLANNTNDVIWSSSRNTVAGGDIVYLTATGNDGGNVRLLIENLVSNDTSFRFIYSSGHIGLTTLELTEKTDYDFLTYNGDPLSTTLPYGVYYLKVSAGNIDWFSEWFSVQDIQSQLMTDYSGGNDYDTFTSTGADITSAINLADTANAYTNTFAARTDEKFIFTYDLTLNSGVYPSVRLAVSGVASTDLTALTDGLNEMELTASISGATLLRIHSSAANNFALGSVSLRRKAGDYVHLEFTNARDFNNTDKSIYYAGGWTQQAYLRAYENLPTHETIEEGNEKNGELVVEKLVSKYTRSVVSYETRAMYDALRLLPLHSTIKILDEVGVEHTPKAGNVNVAIDWNTFDTGSLKIAWNEVGTTWTNSSDNIS